MSLVTCGACGHPVSDKAVACPKCCAPLGGGVVPVQRTAKYWKALVLIGLVLCLVGLVSCVAGQSPPLGVLFFALGLTVALAGVIGGWWHHG